MLKTVCNCSVCVILYAQLNKHGLNEIMCYTIQLYCTIENIIRETQSLGFYKVFVGEN